MPPVPLPVSAVQPPRPTATAVAAGAMPPGASDQEKVQIFDMIRFDTKEKYVANFKTVYLKKNLSFLKILFTY